MSGARFVGRTEGATVPRYHLYGETASGAGDWFVNVEPLADRCRANGWRIEPHSHPHFGQIVFVRGGAGLMTVETDRRPFASPSVLVGPVNTVHGFDYGMDSDGWVLTVADEETSDIRSALLRLDREVDGQAARWCGNSVNYWSGAIARLERRAVRSMLLRHGSIQEMLPRNRARGSTARAGRTTRPTRSRAKNLSGAGQ